MFLKSMELMGFKSFADRTHIDFSSGISALLGPNGCGKSNIVDAVKWVLGEQSTKNMRAIKMEDVIFNGTVKRKALNVAEVTLTISNETNILELDAPEIEIKRRLYRNGDSEYFINGTIVRLKELRELFFDTGIGKTAYSILEQGKIDQILSSRPEERRYLFEEAAGITKYKSKGQEAERKLEKTRENIVQVKNILSEVSKTYFTLKEQAEKTEEYRNIKEQLFEIEVNLQILKIKKIKELHSRRGDEHKKRQEAVNEIEEDIKKLGLDLGDSHKNQGELKNELADNQKQLYGINLEKDSIKTRLQNLKERDQEYSAQLNTLKGREEVYNKKSSELKKEVDTKKYEQKELEKELDNFNKSLEGNVKEYGLKNVEVEKLTEKIENNKTDIVKAESERDIAIEDIKNLATKITDKVQNSLKGFSLEKHNTLIEMFRKQLKLARTNPSILFNLEDEFSEIIKSFPSSLLNLAADDKDFNKKVNLDKKLKELNNDLKKLKKDSSDSENKIVLLKHELEVINELISKNKVNLAETKIKISSISESLALLNKNLLEEEGLLSEIKKERTQFSEKIKQLGLDKRKLESDRAELDKKESKINLNIKNIEAKLIEIRKSNSTKENLLTKQRESLNKLSLQIERFNFESEHLDNKVDELYEEFQDKYSIDLIEASKGLKETDANEEQLKEHLNNLRVKQKMVGQINLMAPEEFKEVSKRYEFLKSQIEDLTTADKDLSKITDQIKTESTKLFTKTFEDIKTSFSVMYQRLFGGGHAELKLTDSSNILESGIEIYARPPGKSLENISLLSGGERSLTAVALLFATYSIKPSPFCILDEIDAALDERNISRFVSTLTEFSKESQCIVITHNKKTVTGSGALLGVTMEESGVSKLISMRLEHEEKEEEEEV